MPATEATLRIAAADHVRGEGRGQRDRRLDEYADLLELAHGIGLMEGAAGGKAGVVDQHVDLDAQGRDPAVEAIA